MNINSIARKSIGIALIASIPFTVGACGGEDEPADTDKIDGVEWFTTTDPQTSKTLRCVWRYKDGGYDGGAAMWCLEVAK